MNKVQIVEVQKDNQEDIEAILKLMHEVYDGIEIKSWFSLDEDDNVRGYIQKEGFALKAMVDDELAGIFVARCELPEDENLGEYLDLSVEDFKKVAHMEIAMVRAKFRGMHIQEKLMQQGGDMLSEKGYRYLMGTAHPENIYSVNNFLKCGYHIVTEALKYGGLRRYIFCKEI